MALVDDDQVEEVGAVLAEHVGVRRAHGLVDAEIDVPALADIARRDLVARVAKRREHLRHRVVHQEIAVGQEQDFRSPMLARPVPAAAPELPADLERHAGLAGARGQCRQDACSPGQDGLDDALDRDALVVAWNLARTQVERLQQRLACLGGQGGSGAQTLPEFVRRRIALDLLFSASEIVDFDDAPAVGGVSEFQAEGFGIVAGLLDAGFRRDADPLGFDDGQRQVASVVQQVVDLAACATANAFTGENDPPVREAVLFPDHARAVEPSRFS